MSIEFKIILQGHDWENDLHFNHFIATDLSLFENIPNSLLMRLDVARRSIENEYKNTIIKKQLHLKVVD
jgi:hypothetical protein